MSNRLILLMTLTMLSPLGWAQTTNALPVNLTADHGEYDAQKGIATYTGNVVITQGEMKLTGDKIVLHTENGEVTQVESWGDLATFHYVPDKAPPIDGKSRYIRYLIPKGEIFMQTDAYVRQQDNDTYGDTLTYHLNSERVKGARVKMTFQPKKS